MDSIPVYVGLDVAADVIRMDQQRFAHHRNKGFAAWDFAECPLPKYAKWYTSGMLFSICR